MSTAQMTQAAPRTVTDIHPPAPTISVQAPGQAQTQAEPAVPSTEIRIVNDLPVRVPTAPISHGFNPIMSAEHHASPQPVVSEHVAHAASQALHTQAPEPKKSQSSKKAQAAPTGPKPILETVLLLTACLIACTVVAVAFSAG